MQAFKPTSLGDQVSTKISAWILIFVAAVITAIFIVSFALSRQMFNKQVNIWDTIAPQQTLTNLLDSDHFSIKREVEFLKSTGLFSSVVITDNKKRIVSQFGGNNFVDSNLIPIQDDAKVVWGYYYFKTDFYRFISPFVFAAGIFFLLIMFVYFVIRWRIRISLESEFTKFNNFLAEIEAVTERLNEIHNKDAEFNVDCKLSQNSEQIIINKAITRLLDEIKKSNNSLREAVSTAEQRRFQEELTKTALQVVHDIGSPIAVLEIVQSTALTLPEDDRLLVRNAISRIRDISNTLLKKARKDFSSMSGDNLVRQGLQSLIDQVITEKRAQYGCQVELSFGFDQNAYKIFSLIKPAELSRIISNLINNSVEAIERDNRIKISLTDINNEALIEVYDNGKGIPADVIGKLGELGGSFGKSHGTGVGLNHAVNVIKEWGGRFDIKSEEGKCTTVQIYLPKCDSPLWSVSEINVTDKNIIAIIDDDESIHAIWRKKFEQAKSSQNIDVDLLHFYSPQKLIQWYQANANVKNILYLCDYEFIGSDINGIDLITQLHINNESILVTSSVVDAVITRCESENIKMLPKNLASPVLIVSHENAMKIE